MPHARYQLLALARPETILSAATRHANATVTLNLHSFFSNSTRCFLLVSADSDFGDLRREKIVKSCPAGPGCMMPRHVLPVFRILITRGLYVCILRNIC
jgi:hypothetical protein